MPPGENGECRRASLICKKKANLRSRGLSPAQIDLYSFFEFTDGVINPRGGIGSGGSFEYDKPPPRAAFFGGKSRIFVGDFFLARFFRMT